MPSKPDRAKTKLFYTKKPHDRNFLMLVFLLLGTGLLMLFSASYPEGYYTMGDPYYYIKRQLFFALIGTGVMFLVSAFDYENLAKLAFWLTIVTTAMLIVVLIPSIGRLINNARRWFVIFGVSVQPSEFVKFSVILTCSTYISRMREKMKFAVYGIWPFVIYFGLIAFLMMMEPHLSGTIIIVLVGAILMFVGGIDFRWVLGGLGGVAAFLTALFKGWIPYGQNRIAMWKDPFVDSQGDGYQLCQSLIAIGSGGLTGKGFGQSRQKYLFLPESQNDFIFAVICEEMGYLGALLILLAFLMLIIRGFTIARYAQDRFGKLLVIGIMSQLSIQTFFNIAVVTGLIPTTGVSLPFFSYGGSALLVQMAEMGVVLSVSRRCERADETTSGKRTAITGRQKGTTGNTTLDSKNVTRSDIHLLTSENAQRP